MTEISTIEDGDDTGLIWNFKLSNAMSTPFDFGPLLTKQYTVSKEKRIARVILSADDTMLKGMTFLDSQNEIIE